MLQRKTSQPLSSAGQSEHKERNDVCTKDIANQVDNHSLEDNIMTDLKVLDDENGKTGKWLAEQVGKNEATVSRWCSNKMQPN